MVWATSDRRTRLPRDWATRVATVRARAAGQCEAPTHAPECDGIGSECDHIARGDDHQLANLQWLSTACHRVKTQRESLEARAAIRARLRLPTETHPSHTHPRTM